MTKPGEAAKTKVIRIQTSTWYALQGLAEPFRDTPADVITRLLDFYLSSIGVLPHAPIVDRSAPATVEKEN
jgi:hypothetical protein